MLPCPVPLFYAWSAASVSSPRCLPSRSQSLSLCGIRLPLLPQLQSLRSSSLAGRAACHQWRLLFWIRRILVLEGFCLTLGSCSHGLPLFLYFIFRFLVIPCRTSVNALAEVVVELRFVHPACFRWVNDYVLLLFGLETLVINSLLLVTFFFFVCSQHSQVSVQSLCRRPSETPIVFTGDARFLGFPAFLFLSVLPFFRFLLLWFVVIPLFCAQVSTDVLLHSYECSLHVRGRSALCSSSLLSSGGQVY